MKLVGHWAGPHPDLHIHPPLRPCQVAGMGKVSLQGCCHSIR
jgi:hypothetical protein